VPKIAQHNGHAKRMNKILTERITSMLSHAKLPSQFWAEALMTAVYVLNLSPCVPLQGDIPQKVWSGKEVSYKNLKVFWCRAFVHVPRDDRSKLDSKTKQCVFLGHPDEQFGYRLWDLVNMKIVRSQDVQRTRPF
jgi:hypothetical protein